MNFGIVFDEGPCSQKDDGYESDNGNIAEKQLFDSVLKSGFEEDPIGFENDGVVDQVHDEEVGQQSTADIHFGVSNFIISRSLANQDVDSNPREDAIDLSHVFSTSESSAS